MAAMVRSGRHFVHMSGEDLERDLGIRNPLHRKRILLILRKIEQNNNESIDKWDMHLVSFISSLIIEPVFTTAFP